MRGFNDIAVEYVCGAKDETGDAAGTITAEYKGSCQH
jgi:hypothetical protein